MGIKHHPALSAAILALCMIFLSGCKKSVAPTSNDPSPKPADKGSLYDFEGDPAGRVPPGFTAGLTWRASPGFEMGLGYRILDIDFDDDGFTYDIQMSGPMIGFVWTF